MGGKTRSGFARKFNCVRRRDIYILGEMGWGMLRLATGPGRGWRRVTAGALIYALVLQGMAFALIGARMAAAAVTEGALAAYELCHDVAADPGSPAQVPNAPAGDTHCVFCLVGANLVLDAPATSAEFRAVAVPMAPWPFVVWRLPADTVWASARPRGPPPQA